jgi:hypothetical protein
MSILAGYGMAEAEPFKQSCRSPLSPFELGGEHFEKCLLETQQPRCVLSSDAPDHITVSHGHADLSIEAEVGFLLAGLDLNFNLDRIAHHHGAMRQSMG